MIMHQELVVLSITFPCLVSWVLISCLKTAWKSQVSEFDQENEVYQKTVVPVAPVAKQSKEKDKKDQKKTKTTKTPKTKEETKDNKKKTSKFFVFRGKDDDLKSPISSDLSLKPTQSSFYSEEDNENYDSSSPLDLDSHLFSDLEEQEEFLGDVVLLPTPPSDYVDKLRNKVYKNRHRKKSPKEYFCADDEDTLFSVPSLAKDPMTMHSTSSMVPLDIQDSRILHVRNERLGWKKSHAVYTPDSAHIYN